MRNRFFRKNKLLLAIVAVFFVGGGIVYAAFFRSSAPQAAPLSVVRGTVRQEVIVTGKTKPVENVDLAFERTGMVEEVDTQVGDKVVPGAVLVKLDTRELQASLREMQASMDAAEAKLAQLKQGTRPEDVQVKRTELAKAKQDLVNDYLEAIPAISDAYAKADDVLRNQIDFLFTNGETSSPRLTFTISNSQLQTDIENMRVVIGAELGQWKTEFGVLTISSSPVELDAALDRDEARITHTATFLTKVSDALSGTITLSASTLATYKTNVNTARTAINTALTNVSSKKQTISSQKIAVQKIQDELDRDLAGTVPEEIQAQTATVAEAQAKTDSISIQITKSTLRSPIAGVVVKQDAKVGQIVTTNSTLVSIISEDNLEIEANVPEVDIGQVTAGNPVQITLDALPGEHFSGKVFYIDPAETVVDGVVNFKVKINFDRVDPRIKSGLTANLAIETKRKEGVLILPQFAVIENDKGTFVKKFEVGIIAEIPVVIGIRSRDGNVEIVSGLSEGDAVVNIGAKTSENQ